MDGNWQTWTTLAIVAVAAFWMTRRLFGRVGGECGGACNCPRKGNIPKEGDAPNEESQD